MKFANNQLEKEHKNKNVEKEIEEIKIEIEIKFKHFQEMENDQEKNKEIFQDEVIGSLLNEVNKTINVLYTKYNVKYKLNLCNFFYKKISDAFLNTPNDEESTSKRAILCSTFSSSSPIFEADLKKIKNV
ncbi:13325_t:CDS:2 [Entrophospora sp. SA101]|nr:13325_t:CDS:2 [Entrophospora sp. SA101]